VRSISSSVIWPLAQSYTENVHACLAGLSLKKDVIDDKPTRRGSMGGEALTRAVSAGDGVTDLAIGVTGGNVTSSNQEGYVFVLYGSKTSGHFSNPYNLSTIY
jgi:hypothetical protein